LRGEVLATKVAFSFNNIQAKWQLDDNIYRKTAEHCICSLE